MWGWAGGWNCWGDETGSSLLCDTKIPGSVSGLPFPSLLVVFGTTAGSDGWPGAGGGYL